MKDITSLRGTLDFLKEQGELLVTKKQVDPLLEVSGLQKALDNGPALLFEKIKGYPGARYAANILAREETTAAMFGLKDFKELKFKCLEAINDPLPPRRVKKAPCQEVVVTKDVDILGSMPVLLHSPFDCGRIIGGGIIPTMTPLMPKGSNLCFKRMRPLEPAVCSLYCIRGSHLGQTVYEVRKGEKIPITINIGVSPAVVITAATELVHAIVPYGADVIGIAGAMQGAPVEMAKAVTVDAPVIANAEWVIEGYLTPERVWESEEAAKSGVSRSTPFFPEWTGYLGKAARVLKFQATAITHRRDGPIYYNPLAHGIEYEIMNAPLREACFFEMAERVWPGVVKDAKISYGLMSCGGIIYQVDKKNRADEAAIKNILEQALTAGLVRLAIAVDQDIDVNNADDVSWAIVTRANYDNGLIKAASGALSVSMLPAGDASQAKGGGYETGGLAIDATTPLTSKSLFQRAHYPADSVDPARWFKAEDVERVKARQNAYARLLARTGE